MYRKATTAIAPTLLMLIALMVIPAWISRDTLSSLAIGTPNKNRQQKTAARAWPMFGGTPQRNMVNLVETNIPPDWELDKGKEKNLKWVAQLGNKTYAGPVIAGGKIFVGTNNANPRNPAITGDRGILMCFDQKTGKFLWQAVHDKLATGRVNDWPLIGITSTPCVEGNRLYYVSNRCELICADTEGFLDGKNDGVQDEKNRSKTDADIVWRLDMRKSLKVFPRCNSSSSPLVVGDLVFVVTGNGVDKDWINIPNPLAPSFIAVNKRTGKLVWGDNAPTAAFPKAIQGKARMAAVQRLRNQGKLILSGQWSSPVYADVMGHPQVIFPGGDGWLRAFEPQTGNLIWKFDCNPKPAPGKNIRNHFIATPVVYQNKLYIGVGENPEFDQDPGHLWCIDLWRATRNGPRNRNRDVSPVNNNFNPQAKVNANSALHWHYGGPTPRAAVVKLRRRYYFGRTLSTCAIHDGLVYITELDGYLHCLDAQTGQPYWSHNFHESIWSSPFWVDGKIYVGTDDKWMYVFAHGRKKRLLNEMEMYGRVRCTPVAANRVLYVATQSHLYAIASGQ